MTTLLEPLQPVAVLGSGGWGTALAVHLGRLGKPVWLWGRNQSLVTKMVADQENRLYLSGVELPERVRPTHLLEEALDGARCVVCAVPSHAFDGVIMGFFIGKHYFRKHESKIYLFLALLVPIILHGLYDWTLMEEKINSNFMWLIMAIQIYLVIFLFRNLKKLQLIKKYEEEKKRI